jgi:hypothetical protein
MRCVRYRTLDIRTAFYHSRISATIEEQELGQGEQATQL